MSKLQVPRIAVLVDLNGTLHVEDKAIPGCIEALKRLRANERVAVKFVTNTTLDSSARLNDRLINLGFDFAPSEIFSSLSAAKSVIQRNSLRPMLLLENEALPDFEDVDQSDPNAVVVGLAPSQFNYATMNKAFRLLMNGGSKLIAIHMGRFYMKKDGLTMGPGPFVKALQYATDSEVEVVGKPERAFFHSALDALDGTFNPCDAIMIGDDVRDDAIGAINAGMHSILVKTGKYRKGDELQIDETSRNCVEDFPAAVELIEKCLEDPTVLK